MVTPGPATQESNKAQIARSSIVASGRGESCRLFLSTWDLGLEDEELSLERAPALSHTASERGDIVDDETRFLSFEVLTLILQVDSLTIQYAVHERTSFEDSIVHSSMEVLVQARVTRGNLHEPV